MIKIESVPASAPSFDKAALIARYRDVRRRLNSAPLAKVLGQRARPVVVDGKAAPASEPAPQSAGMLAAGAENDAQAFEALEPENAASDMIVKTKATTALELIAARRGVSIAQIRGEARPAKIVDARFDAIWLVSTLTHWSRARLGRFFGDRDHTTIRHALKRAEQRFARDPALLAELQEMERACC